MSLFSTISVWWWGTKKKIGLIFWKTRTKANTVFNQSEGRHKNSKKQQANCMIWRKMWVLKYQSFSVLNLIPAATNFPKFWSEGFYSCFKYFQKIDKLWQQYKIVCYNSAIQKSSCNHLSAWQKNYGQDPNQMLTCMPHKNISSAPFLCVSFLIRSFALSLIWDWNLITAPDQ